MLSCISCESTVLGGGAGMCATWWSSLVLQRLE